MAEPKRRTVYKSKYTGRIWSTRDEALKDNYKYKNDVEYRMQRKADTYKNVNPTVSYSIPFIKSKKRTLTNAGLATGAVISENMLDTIAKHAETVGLPIKTALGLATKETTLGNWTDDKTFHTLFKKGSFNRKVYGNMYNAQGTKQNINPGVDIDERSLVNFHDERNPYKESMDYAYKKAEKAASKAEWNTDIGKAMSKTYAATIDMLTKGEAYADKQAEKIKNIPKTHVLDAAFSKYKNNPNSYNPGQPNYPKLVEKRGNEVWNSPEVQSWYKNRRRTLETGGLVDGYENFKKEHPIISEVATYLPVVGTAMDAYEAYKNPTAGNIANAVISLGADVLGYRLLKNAGKAYKAYKAAKKAKYDDLIRRNFGKEYAKQQTEMNFFGDEEYARYINTVLGTQGGDKIINLFQNKAEKERKKKKDGGSIHIAPSKRGTFTAAATKHHMGVQEFASTVLRNKDRYSPAMVKKANFARNASKWNH